MLVFILLVALLGGCASPASSDMQTPTGSSLLVSGPDISKRYTRADLEALPPIQSTFNNVAYLGVSVATLLEDAGFNLDEIKAIKAVASDGYSVNYDPSQALGAQDIVAYAQANGELTADDGAFRVVLPGQEGKLNVRMLIELQVVK